MKRKRHSIHRRDFLKKASSAGAYSMLPFTHLTDTNRKGLSESWQSPVEVADHYQTLDLSPAKWIWYPSRRTLVNTFVLFRRAFDLSAVPEKAEGWILAESRYKLYVNGKRVQFGPAPSDPRWSEADPVNLSGLLKRGKNVIAFEVLYFGHGDGTWPIGKPGFLFSLQISRGKDRILHLVSDRSWQTSIARSWPPGQYKRWYLRALQESFDARKYPTGWKIAGYAVTDDWLPAMEIKGAANKPAICHNYGDYLGNSSGIPEDCAIRARSVPLLREIQIPVRSLAESFFVKWHRPPEEYFEFETPDAYEIDVSNQAYPNDQGWEVKLHRGQTAAMTFELEEQVVGFPYFTIVAPAGTTVELMVQEGHELGKPSVMNTHFHAWTRFVCKEGVNHFETFDFESLRWIQLLIRHSGGTVLIQNVGVRRRIYDWERRPEVRCSDDAIQRLIDASVNTIYNAAQETLVDGMGRERQQYSGDIGHALHALFLAFGNTKIPARFVNTYSQGLTKDGFFLDCWPAYDRLHRMAQRQLDLTPWGPLLDHGIGFNFDCFYYYLYSGDKTALREVYPRLRTFINYLKSIQLEDGLLPVENIGVPTVWIDHEAYPLQRHKQCVFNLYAVGMLRRAFAPLATAFEDVEARSFALEFSNELLEATTKAFWSEADQCFIDNLPWIGEEGYKKWADRTIATAYLYDLFPEGMPTPALQMLNDCPEEMGLSYPANAGWRLWALGKAGKIQAVLDDFRGRWNDMSSVGLNNTLQEGWSVKPDSNGQWSHLPVAPLYVLYMHVVGIQVLEPGFRKIEIRPQLGDLESLHAVIPLAVGQIVISATGSKGNRVIDLQLPAEIEAILIVPEREELMLPDLGKSATYPGYKQFSLSGKEEVRLELKFT